jgi:hypothetical protein
MDKTVLCLRIATTPTAHHDPLQQTVQHAPFEIPPDTMVLSADHTLKQHFGNYSCAVVPDNMALSFCFYVTVLMGPGAGSVATTLAKVQSMKQDSGDYTCAVDRFT